MIYFEKLYAVMNEQERRRLMEELVSEIHIFEDKQPNGQWLKSIKFRLPIIEEDMELSLEDDKRVEICVFISAILFCAYADETMSDVGFSANREMGEVMRANMAMIAPPRIRRLNRLPVENHEALFAYGQSLRGGAAAGRGSPRIVARQATTEAG